MIHDTGNRILNSMERKIGGLALPMILRWIAGFQALSFILGMAFAGFLSLLAFDKSGIFAGEIWRIVSWVFFPASMNLLFMLIATMFMFFINDSLENAWGSFRLNVYVVMTVLLLSLAGLLVNSPAAGATMIFVFYSASFLAFATIYPDHVIHLFFVIPIKAKWLGIANAAMLSGSVAVSPTPIKAAILVLVGLIPYFLVFVPLFFQLAVNNARATSRRNRFESDLRAAGGQDGDPFHECEDCGATDLSHPNREFRVTAEGAELCEECRVSP